MVQKRSFYDDELCNSSPKHPRLMDYNNQLVSFSEFVSPEIGSPSPHAPGECGLTENDTEVHERLAREIDPIFPISDGKEVDDSVHGSSSISSSNMGFNEEVSHPEIPTYISCPSECFSLECPFRTVSDHEDIYSLLLGYPPRKPVPIGSDHQADITDWNPLDCKNRTESSGTPGSVLDSHLALEEHESRLMGTCVIPMPHLELDDEVENVKVECCCLDEGSARCARQHIAEARHILERNLGKERFEELGFGLMGEQVAEKWSKEEEELFHEVVFSNPVSHGRNFWNYLFAAFPSRTEKEIVCYYFNVFMLRRRAEQNRRELISIYDSDDDEWQGSDDGCGTEEDEDSAVDSPLHQDDSADADSIDFGSDGHGLKPKHHLLDKLNSGRRADEEVEDDSCTSSDAGASAQGTDAHWPYSSNGLSYGSDRDHVLEPSSNVNVSDTSRTICPKVKVDFLPIEEVFGDGSWD